MRGSSELRSGPGSSSICEGVHDQAMDGCAVRLCWGSRRLPSAAMAQDTAAPTINDRVADRRRARSRRASRSPPAIHVHRHRAASAVRRHGRRTARRSARAKLGAEHLHGHRDRHARKRERRRSCTYTVVSRRRRRRRRRARRRRCSIDARRDADVRAVHPGHGARTTRRRLTASGRLDGAERDADGRRPEHRRRPATWSTAPTSCRQALEVGRGAT